MFNNLAPELKIAIAHHVRRPVTNGFRPGERPQADVRSLSLTSKAWSTAAQVALFQRVEVKSAIQIQKFRKTLETFPSLVDYVAEVHFGDQSHVSQDLEVLDLEDIVEITALLPNLSEVGIHNFYVKDLPEDSEPSSASVIATRRQINVLEMTTILIPPNVLTILLRHLSTCSLRMSAMHILVDDSEVDADSAMAWAADTVSWSTVRRLVIDELTADLWDGLDDTLHEVSILEPFMHGTLESLRMPKCPLVQADETQGLTALAAILKDGVGINLRELELNLCRPDDYFGVSDTEDAGSDVFGPISRSMTPITLKTCCPRLTSLIISVPLFGGVDPCSTEKLPEWRYALRLITSSNLASLTRITIYVTCRLSQLKNVDFAVSDTLLGALNWTHLDEVLSRYPNLEPVEFRGRFGSECGFRSQTRNPAPEATIPRSFRLDSYLEEKMPALATRGILYVGPFTDPYEGMLYEEYWADYSQMLHDTYGSDDEDGTIE
ncbi:hypothetical protein EIP91_008428 [Steccherinum ochraceum]|uniref:F-box domain-containing protein n=1 Tax=Steccherinum ochraceum TaxID=92696 RepID=A0A4R0RB31_9APHY|nr:hypothetical protein EIP91_008428 [Steccherinum ochraceum]